LIAPSVLSNVYLQKIPLMYLDRGTILSRYPLWSVYWPSVLLHDNPPEQTTPGEDRPYLPPGNVLAALWI